MLPGKQKCFHKLVKVDITWKYSSPLYAEQTERRWIIAGIGQRHFSATLYKEIFIQGCKTQHDTIKTKKNFIWHFHGGEKELLIHWINEKKILVFFSTMPSCYNTKSLQCGLQISVKSSRMPKQDVSKRLMAITVKCFRRRVWETRHSGATGWELLSHFSDVWLLSSL
jgi:hypothetical protein